MEILKKFNRLLMKIGVFVSGIAVLGMMLIIVIDVTMRNVFSSPLSGTYEIVQFFLMPLAIFPALSYTYQSGVLPRLTEMVEKMPAGFQKFNRVLITIIEIIIFTLLMVYGAKFAMSGLADHMAIPVSGNLIPVYPVYFLVPLSFASLLLEVLLSTFTRSPENQTEVEAWQKSI